MINAQLVRSAKAEGIGERGGTVVVQEGTKEGVGGAI
jgi:hypothetical protein